MVVRTIIAPEYFGVAYYGHYYIPLCTCSSGSRHSVDNNNVQSYWIKEVWDSNVAQCQCS